MTVVKPYRAVPIKECREPLAAIPRGKLAFVEPHPYMALGAPYGDANPWMLRESIVASLSLVQSRLEVARPGWKILLFDAYRPNAVQAFMFARAMREQAAVLGLNPDALSAEERKTVEERVQIYWAFPSDDPATPPPHSTGAAFDCTLCDEAGRKVNMGSPIDELSERSMPDHFANAKDAEGKTAHANRSLLRDIMIAENFTQLPHEWWHFSRGDQVAAWALGKEVAIYGRA